ncbi:MAG: NRDE family protein [Halodesulfurarchaeum sp.]
MCTVVFAWQVFAGAPIAVAANRDERLERDSRPPEVTGADPAILAPGDLQAGGTWMGVNEHRVFVGVTNRWLDRDLPDERSRGLLVRDVLGASTAREGRSIAEMAVTEDSYDGFNLLVADREDAWLLEWDGALSTTTFEAGVHVVTNTGADGRYDIPDSRERAAREQAANVDRVRAELEPEPTEGALEWLDRGRAVLGDHNYGVCVHGDGYGTVSTSLIAVHDDGEIHYEYADGPPCSTSFSRVDGHI